MADFRFVPVAELEGEEPLIIGLSGMSDSGKTYSALLIAQAIARERGGIVAGIDTEGRMKKYRNAAVYEELHPFKALRWTPPFDGDRAIAACRAAIEAGAACIILDSASDEWEGEGGVLQTQEMHLNRMAGEDYKKRDRMNMPAWAAAKKPHQRWHTHLLGLAVPIILCHRARRKIRMTKGAVIDAGIQPICDDRLVYDMMFHLLMDEQKRDGSYAVLKGGYRHERGVFPGGRVDHEAIARLLTVSTGGELPDKPLWDRARREANKGTAALRAFSEGIPADERPKLRPIAAELNRTAKMTDRNLTIEVTQPTQSQPEPHQTDRDGSSNTIMSGDIVWDPPTKQT